MDPISLVTAVITIGGVGLTAGKLAVILYHAVEDARMFDEDIGRIALAFLIFADDIELTERSLKRVCQSPSTSTVAGWIMKKGVAKNLMSVSRDIESHIQKITHRFERVSEKQGLVALVRKVWWSHIHKPDIDKLHPRMESLKSSLSLVYNALHLEVLMAREETPEIKAEMYASPGYYFPLSITRRFELTSYRQELKQTIKKREKTIKTLRRQHLQHEQAMATLEHDDANHSVTTLAIEQLDATMMLLKLGKSLRESETMADIEPRLNRATTRRRSSHTHGRGRRAPRPRTETQREPATLLIRYPSPRPQLRRTRPAVIIPESAIQRFEATAAEQTRDDLPEARLDSMISATSTLLTRETSSSTIRTQPESPITPMTPVPVPAESSFTDVRATRNYHSLAGLPSKVIQGYIPHPRDPSHPPVHVTAHRFGSALEENFICYHRAVQLGLVISPLEDGWETMVLAVSALRELHAIGTVDTMWWVGAAKPPGRNLRLWVLEGGLPQGMAVVLGRPYEKRRRYYSRVPSVSERD